MLAIIVLFLAAALFAAGWRARARSCSPSCRRGGYPWTEELEAAAWERGRSVGRAGATVSAQDRVREFHDAFGFHTADSPAVPPEDIRYGRARLLVEECAEAVAEMLAGHPHRGPLVDDLRDLFVDRSEPYDRPPDVVKVAGELADLIYVTAGGAVNWGVPLDAVVGEVHAANMRKLGPDGRPIIDGHGKATKPPGWYPADLAAALFPAAGRAEVDESAERLAS